ncbi:MAG: putative acyl-CoA dehydrogenase [Ilumatobacteraceae bacterium]|nr:putative acyl-CoA dehydrogenase [Ilumatobacteraceae bacterium]
MTQHLLDELDEWLTAHWDADLTVGEWWELLGSAGWATPTLPSHAYGRDASTADAEAIARRLAERGALGPPRGAGTTVVAPTIAAHGTPDQIETLLRPIVTGRQAWCLLFSEPAAGSDLAALTTSARRDGDEWRIDGRKTWATGAHLADMALVLARSEEGSRRHHGLTCFALDMRQGAAVEVRPMREMTGRALSNDVVLTEARLPGSAVLGGAGEGWIVVNSALTAERQSVGAHGGSNAAPGSIAGQLDVRAGDLIGRTTAKRSAADAESSTSPDAIVMEAVAAGGPLDPRRRQAVMRLHSMVEVARLTSHRADDERAAGRALPGAANIAKLWASEIARVSRDVGLDLLGGRGTLHAYDRVGTAALALTLHEDGTLTSRTTGMALAAQAVSLVGGVDRLQRDLIGERVLGLPKAPVADRPTDG